MLEKTEILSLVLLLSGWLPAGCGDYSNPQLQQDLEFLSAIPAKRYLELRVADSQPRQLDEQQAGLSRRSDAVLGDPATYFVASRLVTGDVNRGVLGFLELVDRITHLVPPTLRQPTRRVWGPWPAEDDPGVAMRFVMEKGQPGEFFFDFQLRPEALAADSDFDENWTSCIAGRVEPRGAFRRGVGEMDILLGQCAEVTGSGEAGSAAVDFDTAPDDVNPDGKTELTIDFVAFLTRDMIADGDQALDAEYSFFEAGDRSGAFDFTSRADVHEGEPGLEARERWDWRVHWAADGCGRADVRLSGGDLGQIEVLLSECWDSEQGRVYYGDNASLAETEGDPADCCLPPAAFD